MRFSRYLLAALLCISWVMLLPAKSRWLTTATPHFELISSASAGNSREILEDLEQLHAVLETGLKLPPGREPRTRVIAFGSAREFRNYKPMFNGKVKEDVLGYYTDGKDSAYIAVQLGFAADGARRTIFHEYLHQIAATRDLKLPLWLNEGLAEFYSTFEIINGRVVLGTPIEEHVKFLRQVSKFSVADLVRINQSSSEYNEGFRQGLFYAQSWALVHYLLCAKSKLDLADGLSRYMALQQDEALNDPARFEQAFGLDYTAMDKELNRYLRLGRFYLYSGEVETSPVEIPELQPANPALVQCALIDLQWRARQTPGATLRLIELAEANPTLPQIPEALGAIAWRQNQWEMALSYWRVAARMGSDNPWVYTQKVERTVLDLLYNKNLDYRLPPELADSIRAGLQRALQLSPNFGEAYELLALAEAFTAQPNVANINLVLRNAGKIAKPHRLLLALAIVRWRVGDESACRELLDVIQAASDAEPAVNLLAEKLSRLIDPSISRD